MVNQIIIYIRQHYNDEVIIEFFNSLINNTNINGLNLSIVSEKNIDFIPDSIYKEFKSYSIYYYNTLKEGFAKLVSNTGYINHPVIVTSGISIYIQDQFIKMLNMIKSHRAEGCFCNQLLSDGSHKYNEINNTKLNLETDYKEYRTKKEMPIDHEIKTNFIDISSCIIHGRNLNHLLDEKDDIINLNNVIFYNESCCVMGNEIKPKSIITNNNKFFKPVIGNKEIEKIGVKVLNSNQRQPIKIIQSPVIAPAVTKPEKKIGESIKTIAKNQEEKRPLKHAEKHVHFHQETKTTDIKIIHIHCYDTILINDLRNRLNEHKIELKVVDKMRMDDYDFNNSIFINLSNDIDLSYSIASINRKCAIIVIDEKEIRKQFKEDYNAIIVDVKSKNLINKLIDHVMNLRNNKNYFDKLTKNLYESYLSYRDFFFSKVVCDKIMFIDRNIYRPLMDRKLINPFQIAIIYNDIDTDYVKEIINKLSKEDNRVRFAFIKNGINGNNITYYENEHNLFRKSICSIVLSNNDSVEITDRNAMLSLACGCPTIIVGNNDQYEFIKKEACFIVEYNNIGSITHILKTFINDKNKLRGIIDKGLAYISLISKE